MYTNEITQKLVPNQSYHNLSIQNTLRCFPIQLKIKYKRYNEILSTNQQTYIVCKTQRHNNSNKIKNDFDNNIDTSNVFLLPTHKNNNTLHSIHPKTNPLTIWITINLKIMSTLNKIIYYLHYHHVGNQITEILPHNTITYIVINQPLTLKKSILNLNH